MIIPPFITDKVFVSFYSTVSTDIVKKISNIKTHITVMLHEH